jgi:hypothetical protein
MKLTETSRRRALKRRRKLMPDPTRTPIERQPAETTIPRVSIPERRNGLVTPVTRVPSRELTSTR